MSSATSPGGWRPTQTSVNVGSLLDSGEWTAWQKAVTLLAAIAVMFDGFDIQILGFTVPSIMREWSAARTAFAPVLALGLAGMVVGSPLAGYCGDRFGRRAALSGCVALFAIATIATAFVHSIAELGLLRFITGMGAGGAMPNASALVAEFAPLKRRALAVKLTIVCVPLGGMLGGLIAAWVLPVYGWRTLYAVAGVSPLILSGALLAALPESPRFLARHPDRWNRLVELLGRMGRAVPAGSSFTEGTAGQDTGRGGFRALLDTPFRRDTLGLWLAFFFSLASIYLVFGWLPALLTSQGLTVAAASSGLAFYNFGGVLGVAIGAGLITAYGSRKPMLIASLLCAVSSVAVWLMPVDPGGAHVALLIAIGVNGLLANAIQTAMYALAAHVYPTAVRATGVAVASSMGRVGGLCSSLGGAAMIQAGSGAWWNTTAVAMLCMFGGLWMVRNHYRGAGNPSA